jgi:histidinol-phosphate aminotransferase
MDAWKGSENVLVVVDEAYNEYVTSHEYADSMKYLRQGRNILILRTFSKIYGLAGLRVGYGIAHTSIITEKNKVRQPFNVNSLAQVAALAALEDEGHVEKAKKINEEGKKFLCDELKSLNIDYVPTEANFIYIILKDGSAPELYNELLKEGVIVRPMGSSEIRVIIGLPEENKRFIKALKKIQSNSRA